MQEKPAMKTENFLLVFIVLAYQFSSLHDQGIIGEYQHIALSFQKVLSTKLHTSMCQLHWELGEPPHPPPLPTHLTRS